ncbi:MAG: histidine kinase N-terminal 7TM domain-containing protein, partial [Candidatus Thermoplasmatota archaeon]
MNLLFVWSFLFAGFISLAMGLAIFFRDKSTSINRVFFLFTLLGVYWAVSGFGLRTADTFQQAYIWQKIGFLWPLAISAFLHFAIIYTKGKSFFKNKTRYLFLYGPAFLFSFLELSTDTLTIVTSGSWGWTTDVPGMNFFYISSIVWILLVTITALILTGYKTLSSSDTKTRKQSTIIFVSLLMPSIFSIFTEMIIPWFGPVVPKLTIHGYLLGLNFIGIGIYKYELFKIKPSTASYEIMSAIPDILFLTDIKGKIKVTNTEQKLDKKNFVGKNINDFLYIPEKNNSLSGILNTKKAKNFEIYFKNNSEIFPVLLSKSV